MTVFVDQLVQYPNRRPPFMAGSCHMTADVFDELHDFATRIGMKRAWFQNHRVLPHYDLTRSRRDLAVKLGAVEMSGKWLIERRRGFAAMGRAWPMVALPACARCGKTVEHDRFVYATPTCFACLPPPLPIVRAS